MNNIERVLAKKLADLSVSKNLKPSIEKNTFACSACKDRGIIFDGDKAKQCICVRQKALQKRFKSANMSKQMRQLTFRDFGKEYYSSRLDQMTGKSYQQLAVESLNMALEFVEDLIEDKAKEGIMFTGPVGSGKTFLACCIANELVERQKQVLFVVVPDLLDEIKASWDKDSIVTEHELIEAARTVEILVLDDLGAHNYTEWTRNKLYSIINYRYNNQLPTIITTNLQHDSLSEQIGERTTSRLIMMCKLARLACDQDIRYQIRARKNQHVRINRVVK